MRSLKAMFAKMPIKVGRVVSFCAVMIVKKLLRFCGFEVLRIWSPYRHNMFFSHYYLRNTRRRLEHLASLPLRFDGSSVLELGAGVGDHTDFFIDRGCRVVTSDARPECIAVLKARYPGIRVVSYDIERAPDGLLETFDYVYCAGLLYHVADPAKALERLSNKTDKALIVSTTVSYDLESSLVVTSENSRFELHGVSGRGCRPSRLWVYEQLSLHFPYVYMPRTQPCHEEFPIDWRAPGAEPLPKAVFIASRVPIESDTLVRGVPMQQTR